MHALELKIPPPLVMVLFGTAMWLVARAMPALTFPFPFRNAIAAVFAMCGVAIAASGFLAFRRAGTTVNPMQPEAASALVNTGIYRYTRNPMYLGLAVFLTGWAFFLANAAAAVLIPLFIAYMTRFQIVPEEIALTHKFGAVFTAYLRTVRRWL
jgi:protein-S-isoprenylcysteine O-methyltransferase Ste14